MKLVIGNKNYSSWSLRPWLLLTHHDIAFEEVSVSLNHDNLSQHLRQFSPSARVPVLIDNDLTIWDSLAICEYVSERYLNQQGWPADLALRAHARSLSCEMHSGFSALRSQLPMNIRARRKVAMNESLTRDIKRIDDLFTDCRTRFHSQGPWLMGAFSIVDCMYAPVVSRFVTYGIEVSEHSQDYMQHLMNADAMTRWLEQAKLETEILAVDEAGTDVND